MAVSPFWAGLSAAGTALAGAGSAYSAITGAGDQGVRWSDVKKNLQFNKGLAEINRATRRQMDRERYRRMLKDAKRFKRYAKKMGVSRYALLGNQGSGIVPAQTISGSTVSPTRERDTGATLARMGQDIGRGVANVADIMHTRAETRLLNARADQIINETQLPKDQPIDWESGTGASIVEQNIHPGQFQESQRRAIEARGGNIQTQPYEGAGGIIRMMPQQQAMDWISESTAAQALFWKDRASYSMAMNKGAKQKSGKDREYFLREKDRLEYIFGASVRWEPQIKIQMSGPLQSIFNDKKIFGSWRVLR